MKFRHYSMNKNSMQLISVYIQNINDITDDEIIIKMQSPLLARYHDNDTNSDSYYTFDKDEFSDVVKENVKIFIQRMNIPVETDDFLFRRSKEKGYNTSVWKKYRCFAWYFQIKRLCCFIKCSAEIRNWSTQVDRKWKV